MSDLNDWRLSYDDTVLPFGTYASGYPFLKQVQISAPAMTSTDVPHASADGVLFGLDTVAGRTLTFEVGIEKVRGSGDRWHPNLDAQSAFSRVWSAKRLRRRVGAVAELANLDRGRVVYGRPRNYAPRLEKVRQGWSELVCDFATVDDLFYGLAERAVVLGVTPGSTGGFAFPVAFPWTAVGSTAREVVVENAGDEYTWPVLEVHGPCVDAVVELLNPNGGVAWRLMVAGAVAYDQAVVIDTRPWRRGAWRNGVGASGMLRGAALDECQVPPGVSGVRFAATDATGTAQLTIRTRDAFAGL